MTELKFKTLFRPCSITVADEVIRSFIPRLAALITSEEVRFQFGYVTRVMSHPANKNSQQVITCPAIDMYMLLSHGDAR